MKDSIDKLLDELKQADRKRMLKSEMDEEWLKGKMESFSMVAKQIHPSMMDIMERAKKSGFVVRHSLDEKQLENTYSLSPPSEKIEINFQFYMDFLVENYFLKITTEEAGSTTFQITDKKINDVSAIESIKKEVLEGLAKAVNHLE
jgi:hypothetical protein